MKYKLIQIETDLQERETANVITHEFNALHIDDVLMRFQDFLKGCGYVFHGTLDFVDEELLDCQEYFETESDERLMQGASSTAFDDQFTVSPFDVQQPADSEHSPYYWDTERNK